MFRRLQAIALATILVVVAVRLRVRSRDLVLITALAVPTIVVGFAPPLLTVPLRLYLQDIVAGLHWIIVLWFAAALTGTLMWVTRRLGYDDDAASLFSRLRAMRYRPRMIPEP